MISCLSGILSRVHDDRAYLQVGPIEYEILIPSADLESLVNRVGTETVFHTLFFIQGDGNFFEPALIGFRQPRDKLFFEKFITVKGIGPKTALRALNVPVSEIAAAIERRDTRFLTGLRGIGKRTAELIVAELSGKLRSFLDVIPDKSEGASSRLSRSSVEDDAIIALVALGESRYNAELLLERVRQTHPELKQAQPEQLIREMLKLRS